MRYGVLKSRITNHAQTKVRQLYFSFFKQYIFRLYVSMHHSVGLECRQCVADIEQYLQSIRFTERISFQNLGKASLLAVFVNKVDLLVSVDDIQQSDHVLVLNQVEGPLLDLDHHLQLRIDVQLLHRYDLDSYLLAVILVAPSVNLVTPGLPWQTLPGRSSRILPGWRSLLINRR